MLESNKLKKQKNNIKTIKKIMLVILLFFISFFINANKSEATTISLGSFYDNMWHYRINGYDNANLFCAQEGGPLSHFHAYEYVNRGWSYNKDVFKSEPDFKKINWIKNHIWEQTNENLYTYEEILSILQSSGREISMADVQAVYGNQSNKFKLYQVITWTYTNGHYVNPNTYLSGSLKKVYNAITALADKEWPNTAGSDSISLERVGEAEKVNGNVKWTFNIKEKKNPVNYNITVYKNGTVISHNANIESNQLIITVPDDGAGTNTYQIIVKQPQVIATATAYTHTRDQNMILISTTRQEQIFTDSETINNANGTFALKIKKVDQNDKAISGIKFNVSGSKTLSAKATGTNGELEIVAADLTNNSIKPGQEFNYTITEVQEDNDYVPIKDPIKVRLIAGTAGSGNNKYYCINYAKFESGKTEETVKLVNGKTAKVSLESSTTNNGNNGTTSITLKVENVKKEFDLALTKKITVVEYNYANSKAMYDPEHQAYKNLDEDNQKGNSSVILAYAAQNGLHKLDELYEELLSKERFDFVYKSESENKGSTDKAFADIIRWGSESCTDEQKNYAGVANNENVKNKFQVFVYALRNKFSIPILAPEDLENVEIDVSNIFSMFDVNGDKKVDVSDGYESSLDYANSNQTKTFDRLNNIDLSEFNKSKTTASYNLDKTPVRVVQQGLVGYEIAVYNEGDIDAKNIQITDYIPAGLEVVNNDRQVVTNGTVEYKLKNSKTVQWTVTTNSDGTKTVKTTILTGSSDKLKHYAELTSAEDTENGLHSKSVVIYCKVNSDATPNKKYYNVAEITAATPIKTSTDRDSTPKNIDSTSVESLINKYSENYEAKFKNKDTEKSEKSEYNYEDDDDFEVVEVQARIFDLSLRKSITKVGNSKDTMKDVTKKVTKNFMNDDDGTTEEREVDEDRLPELNNISMYYLLINGTADYYHRKEAVPVNTGDYVEYTLRVYNEGDYGDYAGYASQITDYLPNGLKFYAIVNQDGTWQELSNNEAEQTDNNFKIGKFKATYDAASNKVVLNYIENEHDLIYPQSSLANVIARLGAGYDLISYYTTELNQNNGSVVSRATYCYQEVKIICKVDNTVTDDASTSVNNYLTNISEITKAKVSTTDGVVESKEDTVQDRDSVPGTINIGNEFNKQNQTVNLKTYYEKDCNDSTGVNDSYIEYYKGIQDDDDFETVVVNQFNIGVEKVDDSGNALQGIKFVPQEVQKGNNESSNYNANAITDSQGKALFATVTVPNQLTGTADTNKYYEMKFKESTDNTDYIPMQDEVYARLYYSYDENNSNKINGIDNIKVYLNGTSGDAVLTLNADNEYTGEFEVTMTDGSKEKAKATWNGNKLTFKIVNKQGTIPITIKKEWDDSDNADKIRPGSVQMELQVKKDGSFVKYEETEVTNPVTLNTANNWTYTWENLPEKINGVTATYKVVELTKTDGYISKTKVADNITTITNIHKPGTYGFKITKQDVFGKVIPSEKTRFDINIYGTMNENNGKVEFSNPVTVKNTEGEAIKTTDLQATTGETTALDEIAIQASDIGKTYYFVVTETMAPDTYTKIDYDVVVPIAYTEKASTYTATKQEAFAVTSDKQKKALTDMSNNVNECVTTESTDAIINVKVPNKEKIKISKSKEWKNTTNVNFYKVVMELHKKNDSTVLDTKEVIGNATATFENLDKYDGNGNKIEYVITEGKAYYRTSDASNDWKEIQAGKDYVASESEGVFINTVSTSGKYDVKIKKVDKKTNNPLSGVTFTVNGNATSATDGNGLTTITGANGVEINKDNVGITDSYEITEVNVNNDDYYKIAKGQTLKLNVTKTSTTENNVITYKLNNISFENGTIEDGVAKKEVTLENNKKVVVTATIQGNTVIITIPNEGKEYVSISKEKEWRNVTNANLYKVVMELHKKDDDTVLDKKEIIGDATVTFDNLDKYDSAGNEIQYEIREGQAYYRTKDTSDLWFKMQEGTDYIADEENNVFINTLVNPGSYNVSIIKVDQNNKKIKGATFNVNGTETNATNTLGEVVIASNIEINSTNKDIVDVYNITEVNVDGRYYKMASDESVKVRVTKTSDVENGQIVYSVGKVEIEGGSIDSEGKAKKTIKLENGNTAEATAEISGRNNNVVNITIENLEKNGKYHIKLIKYKMGTTTPVAGAKFHLIGGNIGSVTFSRVVDGHPTGPLSRENYEEITTGTTPVDIRYKDGANIDYIDTPDNYKLIEADVGADNDDMYIGFNEEIQITVNKNENYQVASVELSINGNKVTEKDSSGNFIYKKTVNGDTIKLILSLDKKTNTILLEVENPVKKGNFNFNLVKYKKGTTEKLSGAGFKVNILNTETNKSVADSKGNLIDGTKEYFVNSDGTLTFNGININKAGVTYKVTVEESTVPDGYIGLSGKIEFTAVSKLSKDGKNYILTPNKSTTIANAKVVEVKENEILVEAENGVKPIIHKGVKDVKNQSSGYYYNMVKDKYENVEDAKQSLHDWVIEVSLPRGVDEYSIYEVSDTIDERLVYDSIASVKIKDGGNTIADLVEGTDYKVNYDEETRMLKITFIGQNQALSETIKQNIGKTIEIRFNTKFALDDDGNIIALNQSVPNQATLTYGNGDTIKSEKPEVHTGGVGLYKYDVKTGKALKGAHFKIATSKEDALNQKFLKDTTGKDVEVISNEKGIAVFTGLEFGEDALNKAEYVVEDPDTKATVYRYNWEIVQTTYYIVETEAPTGYSLITEPIEAIVKKDNYNIEDITSLIQVGNKSNIYDLALRKFITGVKDGATGEEQEVTSRIPQVDLTKLASGESTTATYTHPKDPVLVHTTDTVTYTIRVYNEGPQDAYASIIKDDIPEGLQFVEYTNGDGSINDKYRWKLVDENDNEVTDISKAKYIVTDYLSKDNEKTAGEYLLQGYNSETMKELDYKDVKVQFKVTEPTKSNRILTNYAQITKETDDEGNSVKDRDSTPNEWIDGEDDQDIEKVRVKYFDLALRKWVTQAIVTENGKTVITETGHKAEDDPEEVVKVDLRKSKINDVTVKFNYSIRITNQGEIAGEATEIRDDIPQGLKFVAEDNPDWRVEDGQIVTDKLAGTTLQPGESAEVEILLTWVNSKDNMGVMINTAEINKDHNDYGAPDIDSTPGNNVPGEDDIDDAPVMLTVKTGEDIVMYISIAVGALAIVTAGAIVVKKKVLENN